MFKRMLVCTLFLGPSLACGGESGSTDSTGSETGSTRGGMISSQAVAACGGFTVEDAAAVLGTPGGELEDQSKDFSENLRLCSFWDSDAGTGIIFYLSVKETVDEAVEDMEYGRSMAGFAQETIDQATGTESHEEPLGIVEGIGEEAYFMAVNGTLNVRVGNVQIQVASMDDPEKMKEVGRRAAAGLRE